MNTNDGGPAFPQPPIVREDRETDFPWLGFGMGGMSLRDWFAGMSLQGLLSNAEFGSLHADRLADMAYQHADAMLREREKGGRDG